MSDEESALFPSQDLIFCNGCGQRRRDRESYPEPLKRCPCMMAYLCNEKCQRLAWKDGHKRGCPIYREWIRVHTKRDNEAKDLVATERANPNKQCSRAGAGSCVRSNDALPVFTLECKHHICFECVRDIQNLWASPRDIPSISRETLTTGNCPSCSAGIPILAGLISDRFNATNRFIEMVEGEEKQEAFEEFRSELSAILSVTPGDWSALSLLGEQCMIMERYDEAAESFKKAFNANRNFHQLQQSKRNVGGKRMQDNFNRVFESDPGTLFMIDTIDWDAIEAKAGYNDLDHCMLLSKALAKLGDTDQAAELLDIVEGITKRARTLLGSQEHQELTYNTLVAQAECSVEAGEWNKAEKLIEQAMERRLCGFGLGKLLARCHSGQGKRAAAIRHMGMVCFYEEPWRDDRRRANLKYWRELQEEK